MIMNDQYKKLYRTVSICTKLYKLHNVTILYVPTYNSYFYILIEKPAASFLQVEPKYYRKLFEIIKIRNCFHIGTDCKYTKNIVY